MSMSANITSVHSSTSIVLVTKEISSWLLSSACVVASDRSQIMKDMVKWGRKTAPRATKTSSDRRVNHAPAYP